MRFRPVLRLLALALPLLAAERVPLTFDAVYDPRGDLAAVGRGLSAQWIGETRVAWGELDSEKSADRWRVFDVASGRESLLFEAAALEAALRKAGVEATAARDAAHESSLSFDEKGERALIVAGGDLVIFTPASGAVRVSLRTALEEKVPSFSPDGSSVAFVRANDVWVYDLASGEERRLTSDGSDVILNGILDWVYQEEI
ncbi:MAG TPA: DPP IV N-terminal domain-containing protein, partial [Thermoanaerobaculia bacterium]|nr:DPP IV N-terminal domain-containing protein [Thermoanaerobaculia bacterium]